MLFTLIYKLYPNQGWVTFSVYLSQLILLNLLWLKTAVRPVHLLSNMLLCSSIQILNSTLVVGWYTLCRSFLRADLKTHLVCLLKGVSAATNGYLHWHYASYHLSNRDYDKAAFISQICAQVITYLVLGESNVVSVVIPIAILAYGLVSGGYSFQIGEDARYLYYLTLPRLFSVTSSLFFSQIGGNIFHTSSLISVYSCTFITMLIVYEYLKVFRQEVPTPTDTPQGEVDNDTYAKRVLYTLMICWLKSDIRFFSNWITQSYGSNVDLCLDKFSGWLYKFFLRDVSKVRAAGFEWVALASKELYLYVSQTAARNSLYDKTYNYATYLLCALLMGGALMVIWPSSSHNVWMWIARIFIWST